MYPRGSQSASHRAALLFLAGGMTRKQVCKRFDISDGRLSRALQRIRERPLDGWPEDEVTL
jgi:DNA-binding transcriptional regulator LsrR (DeoR family)